MSRPDLRVGGTKLAVIDHLTLHIYCASGRYADFKVADIIPTMAPKATFADVLLSRKCSKCGSLVLPQVSIIYEL